jgi:hypothetical protein
MEKSGMGNTSRRNFLAGAVLGGTVAVAGPATAASAATGIPVEEAVEPAFGPVNIPTGDPRYPSLVTADNTRFTGSPKNVYVVGSARQVVDAVDRAVAAGRKLAVRGGGHCLENFTTSPDIQTVIDLSEFDGVYYDPTVHAFAVEGGARLAQVYETLFKGWGLTLPAGSCPDVGAGGHIAGGGYGFLSRRYGMAIDHLYAVEVVVVDATGKARLQVATRNANDPHRDLWWAHTGGGGGNFGIVTRYFLRSPNATGTDPGSLLPKAPSAMRRRILTWSWDTMTEQAFTTLLRNYGTWFEAHSAPGSRQTLMWGGLFANHRSAGTMGMITGAGDDLPDAQSLMDTHIAEVTKGVGLKPMSDEQAVIPWLDQANWVYESPGRQKVKTAELRAGYTDDQLAALWRAVSSTDYTNPAALLSLTSLGGAISGVADDATAFPHRDTILRAYHTTGVYDLPDDDAANLKWIRDWYHDMYADTGGVPAPGPVNGGTYINYPDIDLADPKWNTSGVPWSTLYYRDNYPRLQQIKQKYDPRGIFGHALSVQPPS